MKRITATVHLFMAASISDDSAGQSSGQRDQGWAFPTFRDGSVPSEAPMMRSRIPVGHASPTAPRRAARHGLGRRPAGRGRWGFCGRLGRAFRRLRGATRLQQRVQQQRIQQPWLQQPRFQPPSVQLELGRLRGPEPVLVLVTVLLLAAGRLCAPAGVHRAPVHLPGAAAGGLLPDSAIGSARAARRRVPRPAGTSFAVTASARPTRGSGSRIRPRRRLVRRRRRPRPRLRRSLPRPDRRTGPSIAGPMTTA